MKNKYFNYVLVAAVILLWGVIIYRIVGVGDEGSSDTPVRAPRPMRKTQVAETKDTFILLANYRDPFLGSVHVIREVSSSGNAPNRIKKKKAAPVPLAPPKSTVDWSFVKYGGMIKSKPKGKNVAILLINGKENMIASGETAGLVQVLNVTRDSVELEYALEKKYIKKAR